MSILGDKLADATDPRDPLDRTVTVTPGTIYIGEEDVEIEIGFTAPGPMYGAGSELVIGMPVGLAPAAPASVRVTSSGPAGFGTPAVRVTATSLTIPFTMLIKGQTITARYTVATTNGLDPSIAGATTGFAASSTTTQIGSADPPSPVPVTKLTGAVVAAKAASGDVTIIPVAAAVGTPRTFTVTYKALTDLEEATLVIVPMGIVTTNDSATTNVTETLSTSSTAYGYVRPASGDTGKGTLSIVSRVVSGTTVTRAAAATGGVPTIQWNIPKLDEMQTVTTIIGPVNVQSRASSYTWLVTLDTVSTTTELSGILDVASEIDEAQTLDFYATQATDTGIAFAIKNPMDYPAGSKQTIDFEFTANATPIRGGYVRVQLPALWTRPNPTLKEAKAAVTSDAAAKVSVSGDGTLDATTPLSISGNTITVNVDVLDQADTITITYGVGTDKDDKVDNTLKAVIQSTAEAGVKIYGFSKASSDTGEIRKEVSVNVINAADGSGSATITADPGSSRTVQAGSSSSKIHVTFTAAGEMTDGHVILERPAGWGDFQRDTALANYIEIVGSGATLIEPAIGATSNRAIAKVNARLGSTGSFTFVYGGGNGGDQNGVDAQDHLGPATFIIKSDGNDDMVFASLTSETKWDDQAQVMEENPDRVGQLFMNYPGQLRISVGGAAGGSGTATVDTIAVNAADPVTLKFTYTATQTITNGNLKLTVPSGWSLPQTDDPSQPGYTEATGSGIGSAADDNAMSVIVPVTFINNGDPIVITYGLGNNAVATTVGKNLTFTIQIEGTKGGGFQPIGRSPAVTVNPQAAGKGTAVATVTADADGSIELYAGEASRKIVVVYTAAGQMVNGQVKLALPPLPMERAPVVGPLQVLTVLLPCLQRVTLGHRCMGLTRPRRLKM